MLRALHHSLDGLRAAWHSERALRQEAILLILALPAGLLLSDDWFRRAVLIASLLGVMSVELLNTAIEKLCDHITKERNTHIQVIKDMGSAAVFCALLLAAVLWGAAVLERFGL